MAYDVAFKLVLSAVLGGLVGIEREMRDKPAGLRTNMLICLGSTLFMSLSLQIAAFNGGDPTRIAAQIVTGIGFLGAGAVLHSHGFVMGLTTAATIWAVAGIGMAVGSGFYSAAGIATGLCIVTLTLLSFVEDKLQSRKTYSYAITVVHLGDALSAIAGILKEFSTSTAGLNFSRNGENFTVWFSVFASEATNLKVMAKLSALKEVLQVETGSHPHDFNQPLRTRDRNW